MKLFTTDTSTCKRTVSSTTYEFFSQKDVHRKLHYDPHHSCSGCIHQHSLTWAFAGCYALPVLQPSLLNWMSWTLWGSYPFLWLSMLWPTVTYTPAWVRTILLWSCLEKAIFHDSASEGGVMRSQQFVSEVCLYSTDLCIRDGCYWGNAA